MLIDYFLLFLIICPCLSDDVFKKCFKARYHPCHGSRSSFLVIGAGQERPAVTPLPPPSADIHLDQRTKYIHYSNPASPDFRRLFIFAVHALHNHETTTHRRTHNFLLRIMSALGKSPGMICKVQGRYFPYIFGLFSPSVTLSSQHFP